MRVNRLAFQGQDAKDAFVHVAEGFGTDEPFEGFDAKGKLAECQGAFAGEATTSQSPDVLRQRVLRAVSVAGLRVVLTVGRMIRLCRDRHSIEPGRRSMNRGFA